jgi:hypothetical protein
MLINSLTNQDKNTLHRKFVDVFVTREHTNFTWKIKTLNQLPLPDQCNSRFRHVIIIIFIRNTPINPVYSFQKICCHIQFEDHKL